MSDYAMLSLFFSFFLTTFVLSIVMVISEISLQKETSKSKVSSKKRPF